MRSEKVPALLQTLLHQLISSSEGERGTHSVQFAGTQSHAGEDAASVSSAGDLGSSLALAVAQLQSVRKAADVE